MLLHNLVCVLQVILVIFEVENVACNVKEDCLAQIRLIFGNCNTAYSCMRYALIHLNYNMPILEPNVHASHYYFELKNYLTGGGVQSPSTFFRFPFAEWTFDFGETPDEVVLHAYLKEILIEGDTSLKAQYMSHIIENFDMNVDAHHLYPSNFCEKEQAESTCRYQIHVVFRECKTENQCMSYAMSSLRYNDDLFRENGYAANYFETLRDRLNQALFLETIMNPSTFFNSHFGIIEDRHLHQKAIDVANEIRGRFGDNKLVFVTHVYNNEVIDENDLSLYQRYVCHVCQKCDLHIFLDCTREITHVFGEHETAYNCTKYAMQHFKDNMPIFEQNNYARRYYNELKNHLTAGHVLDPRSFWVLSYKELQNNFGEVPYEVVKHAYSKEILIENDKSVKSQYMKHIIKHFDVDDEGATLHPRNFCLKEQAVFFCRTQIDLVFSRCRTQNDCLYYAMSSLTENYYLLNDNPCAKSYFEALRRSLNNERFLRTIEDPLTFFQRVYYMSNNEYIRTRAVDVALEILRGVESKLEFVTKVYNEETFEIADNSIYQLYVRHICQKCRAHDFQTIGNYSPENYCHEVRSTINLNNIT